MKRRAGQLLFWAPRILCLLFAAYLSVFALDVFGKGFGFWETMLVLMMHLIPTALVLIVLAVAWRWEWVGAVLFGALAVFYVVWFWGRFHLSAYFFISGPLALIGVLFLFNWIHRSRA
jgi:hypothetical protein